MPIQFWPLFHTTEYPAAPLSSRDPPPSPRPPPLVVAPHRGFSAPLTELCSPSARTRLFPNSRPLADERCTDAILTFLETTDVGRKAREEGWEKGSDGFVEEEDGAVEVEADVVQGEQDAGDLL